MQRGADPRARVLDRRRGAVLGIGGGFILVPALLFLFRVPTTIVIGTTQMQIVFTMAAATIIHAVTNNSVDILLALLLIIGGAVGAQSGPAWAPSSRQRPSG